METLESSHREEDEEEEEDHAKNNSDPLNQSPPTTNANTSPAPIPTPTETLTPDNLIKPDLDASDDLSEDEQSEDDEEEEEDNHLQQQTLEPKSPKPTIPSDDEEENEEFSPKKKKQKSLASFASKDPETAPAEAATAGTEAMPATETETETAAVATTATVKKPKKKNNNVWTKSTRKGKKKSKSNNHNGNAVEDTVLITPIPRFPDRSDDSLEAKICLSKVYKAEKVELSDDRLSAGSSKGYRMVRATRGVVEGAWYFEIRVSKLGDTGHTRLGWSMEKGDLQAPVGYDGNSFGYRDVDGSKVHKAVREKYGEEGYVEGDVIGCYINLPEGAKYAPKPPHFVWYKGQRYMCAADGKEESPKVVQGSEMSFFKNGVCQGVAFKDLFGGRYYPAASMYTLPNQPNCVVTFNFGPDFEFFPLDFDGRPIPSPMIEAPYHGFDGKVENDESNEKKQ